jgi:hypothetical protein
MHQPWNEKKVSICGGRRVLILVKCQEKSANCIVLKKYISLLLAAHVYLLIRYIFNILPHWHAPAFINMFQDRASLPILG